jgi:hypothetical protein
MREERLKTVTLIGSILAVWSRHLRKVDAEEMERAEQGSAAAEHRRCYGRLVEMV